MTIFFLFICLLMVSGCSGRDASKEVEYQYVRDLERGRVAVISGSTGDSDLNKKFPKMRISRYESASDMVQAIKYGRCDAIGIDTYMAGYLNAEIGGGLVPLDDAVDHLSLGAGFPLGENGELREQFNAFLRQIKLDGTHAKMVDKWVNHTMTAELTPLALPTEGEKMVVGVCSMLPPLGYSKNGELVGLEIELARYFAQYVNRPIEFLGSNQTSLFTSLVAGKTDMVLAGLSITPERKESMDFSESYLNYVETLYVLEKNKKGFNRLKGSEARYQFIQDVLDEPVGVIIGSSLEETLKRMYPQTKVKHYDSERNLVLGLRAGECQSVVIEDYALDFLDHENHVF